MQEKRITLPQNLTLQGVYRGEVDALGLAVLLSLPCVSNQQVPE